jgi:hypothetical protein
VRPSIHTSKPTTAVTQITVIELQQGFDIGDNLMPIAAAKIMDFISVFRLLVAEQDTFEYFVDHCLMRPQFLINIIENAIANGI